MLVVAFLTIERFLTSDGIAYLLSYYLSTSILTRNVALKMYLFGSLFDKKQFLIAPRTWGIKFLIVQL